MHAALCTASSNVVALLTVVGERSDDEKERPLKRMKLEEEDFKGHLPPAGEGVASDKEVWCQLIPSVLLLGFHLQTCL